MKKQINDLLLKMQNGENCIGETANQLLDLFAVSGSLPTDTEIQEWAKKEATKWEKDKAKAVAYASHLIDGALWMRSMLVDNDR